MMSKRILFILILISISGTSVAQTWKELNDSISYYYYRKDFEKTIIVTEKSIIAARNQFGIDHPEYAMSLNKLAQLYVTLEKYDKAIPVFELTIKIASKTLKERYPAIYSTVVDGLAGLYGYFGQYEKAEPLYIEAMEIRKTKLGEGHSYYAISLANLGGLYNSMGQYIKAIPFYTEALEAARKSVGDKHPVYATRLSNLAGVFENMGEYEKAEALYKKALTILESKKNKLPRDYASILNNLGAIYYMMGKYEKAEPLYLDALEEYKKIVGESHPLISSSLNNLGILYHSMGQYNKAEAYLIKNSIIELENLKREVSVLSENEKQEYLFNIVSLPQTYNSIVYISERPLYLLIRSTFNLQLLIKSFTLTDTRNMLEAVRQSGDTTLKRLLENWLAMKTMLARQYTLPPNEQRKDLKTFEKETELLEKELDRRSSSFRNQKTTLNVSINEVEKNLYQDEAAIEFVKFNLFNNKKTDSIIYAAYIVKKNDSIPVFVPLFEEKQLQQLFDSAGSTVSAMVSKLYRGLDLGNTGTSTSLGKDVYNLVWAPLEPYLKGIKRVSYSPAGKLYRIAFHALPVDSNKILMDKYELNQYTSIRQVALRETHQENQKPQSISLFGDARFTMDSSAIAKLKTNIPVSSIYSMPNRGNRGSNWTDLPGTAEEIKKIKQLFEENSISTKSLTQTNASEENLKALSGNSPQILHIATHGFFLPEPDKIRKENFSNNDNTYTLANDPMLRSGLILSGGNYAWSRKTPIEGVEDGIATAYEISQLNLSNTELVVLSACETALGDVKGSEGVFGLQRAFKMAGVKKMIVSLWQVPDKETAELMTAFYGYWLKGKTIEQSFAQAQADMRKKYSPYYWAAFVLVE